MRGALNTVFGAVWARRIAWIGIAWIAISVVAMRPMLEMKLLTFNGALAWIYGAFLAIVAIDLKRNAI